jgi:hypothetical protein
MRKIIPFLAATFVAFATSAAISAPILYGLGDTTLDNARFHNNLYTIDTTTGAATLVGDTGFNLRGLAIDPVTGRAYASLAEQNSGGTAGGLYEINLATGAASLIGGTQNFCEMTFDGAGNLFGYGTRVGAADGYDYLSIDVNTGVGTLLSSTALNTANYAIFGIAYSSADDETYLYQQWFSGSGGEGLWTIDLTDGTPTLVVSSTGQFYRPDLAADDSGNLYTIDRQFGATGTSLYSLDKTTGLTTSIGLNGVGLNSITFANSATATVPEPGALAVFGLGLLGLGYARRKRAR